MRRGVPLLIAVVALVVSACGATDDAGDTTTTRVETTTTVAGDASASSTGPVVSTSESDLGTILTDGEGNTLYLFIPDDRGESVCYDACATTWPPLVGDVGAAGALDGDLLGTAPRTDGSNQVTYDGWPLYYFAPDAAPGDTTGQGFNDVWFVVSPTGDPIGFDGASDAGGVRDY